MRFRKAITIRRRKCRRRVRAKARGTADRPRLSVFRSNCHIYAQLTDDAAGRTLVCANTKQSALAEKLPQGKGANVAAAKVVGQAIAALALEKGFTQVCFDRGSYRYHGRVKALAEAAREAGLKF